MPALQGVTRHGQSSGRSGTVQRRCGRCPMAARQSRAVLRSVAPAVGVEEEGGSGEVAGDATEHETSKERHGELEGSEAELGEVRLPVGAYGDI